jgi:PAS domain S-box-containing protein
LIRSKTALTRYDMVTPEGGFEPRWWLAINAPVLDNSGQVCAHHHQVTRVTEEHHAEVALRASEEQYRELFERIDEGFCIIQMIFDGDKAVDYRFIEVNPAFERHTGIADAKGRLMREIAPEHEQHWFDAYGEVALTGRARRFQAPAAALGNRFYDLNAFPVGDPSRRRVAIVFTDITQRQRDAAALPPEPRLDCCAE